MSENTVGRWISTTFRETPWTAWLIAINLAVWVLNFFQISAPANIVAGELGVHAAWRWLTYPLYTPLQILWLLVTLYVFHWIGSSLERRWGSEKFGRVFVVVTLLTAGCYWVGHAVVQQTLTPTVVMASITLPEITLFTVWAALNSEATILAFFVIPIQAKYLALGAVVLGFFSAGHPILGLFTVLMPIAGWFWAKKPGSGVPSTKRKSIGEHLKERKKAKRKSRFKLLEGQNRSGSSSDADATDLRELNRKAEATRKTAEAAELDRILDKIRFEGMAALTPEERATLDTQSRKLQGG